MDKCKLRKIANICMDIFVVLSYVASVHSQFIEHDTTQALCWLILGTLISATTVEVK